jgi:hypothetical protein
MRMLFHSCFFNANLWRRFKVPTVLTSVGDPEPDPQDLYVFGPPGLVRGTYTEPFLFVINTGVMLAK